MAKRLLAMIVISIVLLGSSFVVNAQSFSTGCTALFSFSNSVPFSPNLGVTGSFFNADERLIVTGTGNIGGTSTTLTISVGGVIVDSAPWPGPVSYTFPADGIYNIDLITEFSAYYEFKCELVAVPAPPPVSLPQSFDAPPLFTDGRINMMDAAAPVVLYPVDVAGRNALHIYSSDGRLVLVVTPDVLANAPQNPDEPVLVAETNGVSLYRIQGGSGGLWQVNASQYNGKTYTLIFSEIVSGVSYQSNEVE